MGLNLTRKILKAHLVEGDLTVGKPILIKIDHTLTQDATGTMAYLEFESLGVDRVQTEKSVSYVDHNTLQEDFKNDDDHTFLRTIAQRYGLYYSRPGNGICHQVHLERFGAPGKTLLGSDSHTPTGGGIGMLAIGAGGLDVAFAMAGEPYFLKMPKVVKINLTGKLQPFVSAKDVVLELLKRFNVKGGVNKIFEYAGPGVKTLEVPERATITNMGAEMGLTTSIFPSDEITKNYMKRQNREEQWVKFEADRDAEYDEIVDIDLSKIVPMVAQPHSPGNVVAVSELADLEVNQIVVGSCTNSSYADIVTVAKMIEGRQVPIGVSAGLLPGSRQIMQHLAAEGYLKIFIDSGVRLLESSCGACIGMGFAPGDNAVSVRTFNRNFEGRSGTKTAKVYLASPETAAACIITGKMTDPRTLNIKPFKVKLPSKYSVDDKRIIFPLPADLSMKIEVKRGPNIKPLPIKEPLKSKLEGEVLIKVGEDITTDHIMPAGAKVLPLRSNIPEISKFVFSSVDKDFYQRALDKKEKGGGIIVGGENYGQGSSREHAAIAPMYLGVNAVIVKSFARIHLANLVNFGIIPFEFKNKADYDDIFLGDKIEIDTSDLSKQPVSMKNITKNKIYELVHPLTSEEILWIKAGGKMNFIRNKHKNGGK